MYHFSSSQSQVRNFKNLRVGVTLWTAVFKVNYLLHRHWVWENSFIHGRWCSYRCYDTSIIYGHKYNYNSERGSIASCSLVNYKKHGMNQGPLQFKERKRPRISLREPLEMKVLMLERSCKDKWRRRLEGTGAFEVASIGQVKASVGSLSWLWEFC